jgi:hypothetical protein
MASREAYGMSIRTESQQFNEWLARTDTAILLCWVNGHWWPGQISGTLTESRYQLLIDAFCERDCGVERRSFLAKKDGTIDGNNAYKYPKGYSPGIHGLAIDKFMRGKIRLEIIRRRKEDAEHA